MHRISLIGFRACGKSTIGRLLAARLAWPFVDADTVVETRLGMPIPAYFKAHGEAAFRDQEEQALAEALAGDRPLVLATGGGAVIRPANRALLRAQGGLVVWLAAGVTEIQERLRHHSGGRPSLTGAHVVDEVPALLAAREPFYRETAELILGTGRPAAALADELAQEVWRRQG